MSNRVCPYCFETFKRSEVMFRCNNQRNCKKEDDPELHKFWGRPEIVLPAIKSPFSIGKLLDMMPNSAVCQQCGKETPIVICPHCHNRIPKDMVKDKGYIISIIGARSSGKTNYITTLINELKNYGTFIGDIGITASNAANKSEDSTEERYKNDFFNIVYKNGKCPAQTDINDPKSKVPLIYMLKQENKTPLYLVFYDTAGENFADIKNIESNVQFLNHSDAVIYLMDTFSIPFVHERLKGPMGLSDIELEYDRIVSNIITYISEGDKRVKEAFQKKPMAIVFSKIDAILKNEKLFQDTSIPGLDIEKNSSFITGDGVDLDDIDAVSNGIDSALEQLWNEQNFVRVIKNNFQNVKFFGISALGGMPDMAGSIKNLRPYRVLDPLVWILHQFKYSLRIAKK